MATLIRLVKTDEVDEGTPVAANPEGLPALAVYKVGDQYYVTDNMCTHGMAWLTDGYQDGDVIECPFHGGAFKIETGEPAAFPCTIPLKTYKVVIEDGYVCIEAPEGE